MSCQFSIELWATRSTAKRPSWPKITSRMRNVLIHAYDQVDLEEVWMAYQRFPEIRRHSDAILNLS
ncbi:HepT-like ribonuclease domain-containing protein [Cyanobium sp. CH-040]|uniref:HepT-like ribonuclease domain-containing protein n=1 Tax=Cyanobium sp. CH-040 TaxID=2823708 RepID=UPI0020CEF80C|nr:HepT-like ribonuclease domain-containing protein [Cyanobium sp. CH-040]MCP9928725.1 DUF86 domain-containing protein [Cyanobium sp. CH-040]